MSDSEKEERKNEKPFQRIPKYQEKKRKTLKIKKMKIIITMIIISLREKIVLTMVKENQILIIYLMTKTILIMIIMVKKIKMKKILEIIHPQKKKIIITMIHLSKIIKKQKIII